MFLWISSNSCPLNLLLVRSHQAEINILTCFTQRRNNVTRVWVKPRSCDHGRRKSDAYILSIMLPTEFQGVLLEISFGHSVDVPSSTVCLASRPHIFKLPLKSVAVEISNALILQPIKKVVKREPFILS